jgi:tRNA A-37 threonylcarbamoyl transferase component Bud32
MSRSLEFFEDTVVKRDAPERMLVEAEKTRRAAVIGESSGLFRVPRLMAHDEASGAATFERLPDLVPVEDLLAFGDDWLELAERVGRCLAVIHRGLELPEIMTIPLPAELDSSEGPRAFLHGDFNATNVCLSPMDEICIIDWQMTSVHGAKATHGTVYFDVVWFVNHLFFRPVHRYRRAHDQAAAARAFMSGYSSESNIPLDSQGFLRYMKEFFQRKMRHRRRVLPPQTRVSLILNNARLKKFLKDG